MTDADRVEYVPIDACQPNTWNPQVEDTATFNELVKSIKQHGFVEPLLVVRNEDGATFTIIGGEHRWKAGKLAGVQTVSIVVKDLDEDMQKILTVKMNALQGRLDPFKFAELFNELEKKYGRKALIDLLGMANKEKMIEQMLARVMKGLPREVQAEMAKRADRIRNVEDLAAVVQSLYAKFGSTIAHGYAFFVFGGRTHAMIRLSHATMQRLERGLADRTAAGVDVDSLFDDALAVALARPLAPPEPAETPPERRKEEEAVPAEAAAEPVA